MSAEQVGNGKEDTHHLRECIKLKLERIDPRLERFVVPEYVRQLSLDGIVEGGPFMLSRRKLLKVNFLQEPLQYHDLPVNNHSYIAEASDRPLNLGSLVHEVDTLKVVAEDICFSVGIDPSLIP